MNTDSSVLKKYFRDRAIYIVTMHQKEQVIAPLIKKILGLDAVVPSKINTDKLGTFSREIERSNSVIETLRLKCDLVLNQHPKAIAIASEGSFGQHPFMFFTHADEEMVMFKDPLNGIEVVGKHLTTETNFDSGFVRDKNELEQFLQDAGFPEQGIILREEPDQVNRLYKELKTYDQVLQKFNEIHSEKGKVFLETDMRAHKNPTRMIAIQKATEDLFKRLGNTCNKCKTPGFQVHKINPGLPCELCAFPTKSTLSLVWKCKHCKFEKISFYPNDKRTESAQYCNRCNP